MARKTYCKQLSYHHAMIFMHENTLLKKKLTFDDIKPRLLVDTLLRSGRPLGKMSRPGARLTLN
ncbi:hypothetical protein N7454_000110 [Penicillium verhagenii]|nr:hypothetical protein N7454_000110 [Penicillium verhagenii]